MTYTISNNEQIFIIDDYAVTTSSDGYVLEIDNSVNYVESDNDSYYQS